MRSGILQRMCTGLRNVLLPKLFKLPCRRLCVYVYVYVYACEATARGAGEWKRRRVPS